MNQDTITRENRMAHKEQIFYVFRINRRGGGIRYTNALMFGYMSNLALKHFLGLMLPLTFVLELKYVSCCQQSE